MSDQHSALTRKLIADGLQAPASEARRSRGLIADLTRIADRFHFTATRIGSPGCRVRVDAAEDEATVREAIAALTAKRERAA